MSDENQQQGGSGKILKKFEQLTARLEQVLNGDTSAYSTKVPATGVPALMAQLIKDRREAAEKEFKVQMSALLDQKVAFDKEVKKMRQETEKAIEKKMDEFNKSMEKVFNIIERVDQTATEYAEALKPGSTGTDGAEGATSSTEEDSKPE